MIVGGSRNAIQRFVKNVKMNSQNGPHARTRATFIEAGRHSLMDIEELFFTI
jgi:hypothetical protein